MLHLIAARQPSEPHEFGVEPVQPLLRCRDSGLRPERCDMQDAFGSTRAGIETPDQPIAFQNRKHTVAILATRFRHEDLDPIMEAEEPLRAIAVSQHRIERRQHA